MGENPSGWKVQMLGQVRLTKSLLRGEENQMHGINLSILEHIFPTACGFGYKTWTFELI